MMRAIQKPKEDTKTKTKTMTKTMTKTKTQTKCLKNLALRVPVGAFGGWQ